VLVLARRSVNDPPTILMCCISIALLFRWKIAEPILIAYAAAVGLILQQLQAV